MTLFLFYRRLKLRLNSRDSLAILGVLELILNRSSTGFKLDKKFGKDQNRGYSSRDVARGGTRESLLSLDFLRRFTNFTFFLFNLLSLPFFEKKTLAKPLNRAVFGWIQIIWGNTILRFTNIFYSRFNNDCKSEVLLKKIKTWIKCHISPIFHRKTYWTELPVKPITN